MTIKILIGADICPTSSNYELFAKADLAALIGSELSSLLKQADYTLFNLETPLTDNPSPIDKVGPCLRAPSASIHGLKAINPHFFTLANNHILDQGEQGLRNTVSLLQKAGIAYGGVGENLAQAAEPAIVEVQGTKLGIYCCAENEFSIATDYTAGANPYDPLSSFDVVRQLKTGCDFVIVLYHGGKEYYRYPSPQVQRVFHKFADCGADLVIAQHTHCIGCMESYQGSTLVYGQGNFLFDHSESEYWQTNLLLEVNINKQARAFSVNYIPCVKQTNGVRFAGPVQAQQILAEFQSRSKQIQEPGFVVKNYQIFAEKLLNRYLQGCSGWLGHGLMGRILNKLTKDRFFKKIYTSKDMLRFQNILRCEAHREVFLQATKRKNKL